MSDEKAKGLKATQRKIIKFINEIRLELKKVIWPTRKQLINNTSTVLLVCLFVGIIIWILDDAILLNLAKQFLGK